MFSISNLSHTYNSGVTINFVDWEAKQGEQWLLSGISGSGKTTLLHIISGLLKPTHGKVIIGNTLIYEISNTKSDKFRGQNIGLVLQKPHLLDTLSVIDNLLLTQYLAGLKQDKDRIKEVLSILQVEEKQNVMPYTLSQGEAQRVAIARAVINKPKILLADEPTASLDDTNTEKVVSLLRSQAHENNSTLVISTHDSRVKSYFDKIYSVRDTALV